MRLFLSLVCVFRLWRISQKCDSIVKKVRKIDRTSARVNEQSHRIPAQ
jgi:hypothetical protein